MKIVELVVALVVLALSLLGLTEAMGFTRASAYLPTAVMGFAAFLSAIWAIQSVVAMLRERPALTIEPKEARRIATLAVLTGLYALSISWIGFFTATVIFLPLAAVLLGYRRPAGLATATVAFMALLYAVFGLLLKTPLPPELILSLIGRTT